MSFGFNLFENNNDSSRLTSSRQWNNTERAVPIAKSEYDHLRSKLVGQGDFNFLESEVTSYTTRRDEIIRQIESNLARRRDAEDDKEAYIEIEAAVARGEPVRPGPDAKLYQRSRAEVMDKPNNLREEDEKLRKRKIEIGASLERCRKELIHYVRYDRNETVYTKGGAFYKLGAGSTSLVQPAAEELRTVGVDFRRFMTNETKLRSLNFKEAKDMMHR